METPERFNGRLYIDNVFLSVSFDCAIAANPLDELLKSRNPLTIAPRDELLARKAYFARPGRGERAIARGRIPRVN